MNTHFIAQNITFIHVLHDHYMYNNLLIWKCFIETRSINLFIHWLKSVSYDWWSNFFGRLVNGLIKYVSVCNSYIKWLMLNPYWKMNLSSSQNCNNKVQLLLQFWFEHLSHHFIQPWPLTLTLMHVLWFRSSWPLQIDPSAVVELFKLQISCSAVEIPELHIMDEANPAMADTVAMVTVWPLVQTPILFVSTEPIK